MKNNNNRSVVYKNPWMNIEEIVVTTGDAKKSNYIFLSKKPGVVIIAFDEVSNCIFFIKEFRHPIAQSIWQLPAGSLETKSVFDQGKKELHDETGITAKKIKKIGGFFIAPGHENSYVHVLLATNLNTSALSTSFQDHNETITEVKDIKLSAVWGMMSKGQIKCGISLASLTIFFSQRLAKTRDSKNAKTRSNL